MAKMNMQKRKVVILFVYHGNRDRSPTCKYLRHHANK